MLSKTADDYSQYLEVDLSKKLEPISNCIDEMVLRLEEFEAMIALVQQERCNSMGMTGSLSETIDGKAELEKLCQRIDTVEQLVEHVKTNLAAIESKVDTAEAQFGATDSTTKLKSFFLPLFKKTDVKSNVADERELFKTETYFQPDDAEA